MTSLSSIRGYELREQLGEGAFGTVYRAFQPSVQRDVAIKVIKPELANEPEFIRRFESEAHLVARLEHPHIVPLYDYWREPDGAYLVMRWLHGGNLVGSLEDGPWSLEATGRLLEQIGSALVVAHRNGVVHRDLKPANILLDDDGNAYLTDFGIAKDLEAAERLTRTGSGAPGSPAYMAPEQLQQEPVSARTDLYALGLVLYEALTGHHAFEADSLAALLTKQITEQVPPLAERRPDLPPALDDVLQRATAKSPAARFSDAVDLMADFRRAIEPTTVSRPRVTAPGSVAIAAQNPYKGLRAFQEGDAPDFFGRERLTTTLLERLAEPEPGQRFLAIVGPSGSGKSSVVRAALVPALRRGALPGSESWFIADMIPGPRPFEELEAALLRIAVNPPASLLQQLRSDASGLRRATKRVLPQEDSELVLIIDQFEELFTLAGKTDRGLFLDNLVAAVQDDRSQLRVIVTLRADFYDRPLVYADLGQLLKSRQETVLPLNPEELERAIAGPAERVGVQLEAGLIAEVVSEVVDQPGALPLLQYALTEQFDGRQGDLLTLESHRSSGGVLGALGRRADEIYSDLDPAAQEAARQLFLRLVTLGEGGEDTRRRTLRSELESLEAGATVAAVVDEYGANRLLSFDRDPVTRGPTVEVAHEALLGSWQRLRGWIEDARDDVRLQARLAAAAAEWDEAGQEPGFLLTGTRLSQIEEWSKETSLALSQTERNYFDASLELRSQEERREQEREEREQLLEERAANRRRVLLIVLAIATAVSSIVMVFAFGQRNNAQKAATEAELQAKINSVRALAAEARSRIEQDTELSLLLAIEAVEASGSLDDFDVRRDAEEALRETVRSLRIEETLSGSTAAALDPTGLLLATAGPASIEIRDLADGEILLTVAEAPSRVLEVAFSPDGAVLALASANGSVQLRDAATDAVLFRLAGHNEPVGGLAFSADGTVLATSSDDGTFIAWSTATGEELMADVHAGNSPGVAVSADGSLVASGGSFRIPVCVVATATCVNVDTPADVDVAAVAISESGILAAALSDRTVRLWNLTSLESGAPGASAPEALMTLPLAGRTGHSDEVLAVAFSPDGSRLASGGLDGTVRIWSMDSGENVLVLAPHSNPVVGLSFSGDGRRLAATSCRPEQPDLSTLRLCTNGQVRVWNVGDGGGRELFTFAHEGEVFSVSFGGDASLASTDGGLHLWDASTGSRQQPPLLEGWGIANAVFDPSGRRLATFGTPGYARRPEGPSECSPDDACISGLILDATDGSRIADLFIQTGFVAGLEADIVGLAFNPDGSLVATSRNKRTIEVWDATAAAIRPALASLEGHTDLVNAAAFSSDGTLVATASNDDLVIVWDPFTGAELGRQRQDDDVTDLAFSPIDPTLLVTAGADAWVRFWRLVPDQLADGVVLQEITDASFREHEGGVTAIAFSLDGNLLATASVDTTARLWEVTTDDADGVTVREILELGGHTDPLTDVAFNASATKLATASRDRTVRVYTLDVGELLEVARDRATRGLTDEECQRFLGVEECALRDSE